GALIWDSTASSCEASNRLREVIAVDHPEIFVRGRVVWLRSRPRRRAAEECDEVAPSHAMPVEGKAYQRAALCVTAKLARLCHLWVDAVEKVSKVKLWN